MSAWQWVLVAVVAALLVSMAVAVPTGKALHRAAHRGHYVGPLDCPPWCVRERAAALTGKPRRRRRAR